MARNRQPRKTKKYDPYEYLHICADILSLVSIDVDASDVSEWTKAQQDQAVRWASKEHLYASDNDVRRIKMPKFLERFKV